MTATLDESLWHRLTEEVTTGMCDWRTQHPKATLREIEEALDSRLSIMRARMLEDVMLQRAAAQWVTDPNTEPPTCPDCHVPLHAHGKRTRTIQTHGGADLHLERTYGTCPQCGRGVFPPR